MNRTEPKMKKDHIVNRTELTAPRCTAFSVNRFTSKNYIVLPKEPVNNVYLYVLGCPGVSYGVLGY